jgi:hypothetical protein
MKTMMPKRGSNQERKKERKKEDQSAISTIAD